MQIKKRKGQMQNPSKYNVKFKLPILILKAKASSSRNRPKDPENYLFNQEIARNGIYIRFQTPLQYNKKQYNMSFLLRATRVGAIVVAAASVGYFVQKSTRSEPFREQLENLYKFKGEIPLIDESIPTPIMAAEAPQISHHYFHIRPVVFSDHNIVEPLDKDEELITA